MLERIETKLDRIIFLLEKNSGEKQTPAPTLPDFSIPTNRPNDITCHQCGINLVGTTGYVCKNAKCPITFGTSVS